MGKSTISMVIFNSYVSLPEGNPKRWENDVKNDVKHDLYFFWLVKSLLSMLSNVHSNYGIMTDIMIHVHFIIVIGFWKWKSEQIYHYTGKPLISIGISWY